MRAFQDDPLLGYRSHDHRIFVDTGPVLEKAYAQAAGLGWLAKNTLLINRKWGSWVFLAVVLTPLDLARDEPGVDHCGSCRRCLDACPTDAFPEPYVLDAGRCIAHWTIEATEPERWIEPDTLGQHVFGCDICQEVCPWNSEPRARSEEALAPRQENIFPELSELASLSAESFAARFPQSPIKRAGFRGLLRNTIIALGNSTPEKGLGLLEELAGRDDIRSDPLLSGTLERARSRIVAGDTGSDYADDSGSENGPGREDL